MRHGEPTRASVTADDTGGLGEGMRRQRQRSRVEKHQSPLADDDDRGDHFIYQGPAVSKADTPSVISPYARPLQDLGVKSLRSCSQGASCGEPPTSGGRQRRPPAPRRAGFIGGLEREGGPDAGHHRDPGDIAGEARRAERLGFGLAVSRRARLLSRPGGQRIRHPGRGGRRVTGRIRLLSAATLLPVYPMVLAAKMAATLDLVSQGRFQLGVGVGGGAQARNSPRAASRWPGGARAPTRALAVLVQLLSGERVTAEGQFG